MAIFLTDSSKVIVQGMTGSEGMKHTQRMLDSGTTIVGGVNPRKAGTEVAFADVSVPVFGTVAEAIAATGAAGPAGIGKVMAVVKPKLAGRADIGAVSAKVKARLA